MPKSNTRKQSRNRRPNGGASSVVPRLSPWGAAKHSVETKFVTGVVDNVNLGHNVPYTFSNSPLLEYINQGAGASQRIGSEIMLREFHANFVLNNKTDRPNVSYRIVLVASTNSASSDAFAECFRGGAFTGCHNPNSSVLLHDALFPGNQGSYMDTTTGKERSHLHSMKVVINKPVVYDSILPGTCLTRLACYVIAYDAFGTLITDNIASVAQASWRIIFSD